MQTSLHRREYYIKSVAYIEVHVTVLLVVLWRRELGHEYVHVRAALCEVA